jgi:transposase
MHYIEPADRTQFVFLNKLDDMVSKDNIVRLLDYLVEAIVNANPIEFGDKGISSLGRKAYSPNLFIKLYIYGYLNGINSSRKLEKEAQRNIELIWLLGNLQPDFKTIADYRKDNGDRIKLVLNQFGDFLKDNQYIQGSTVSLDGTKVRANAGQLVRIEGIESKLKNLLQQLNDYFETLDRNDADDDFPGSRDKEELLNKINELEQKVMSLQKEKEFLQSQGLKQYSPTDPESRIMKGREGKHFCYNVQAAVDEKHKMLITAQVTNAENDKNQLEPSVEHLADHDVKPNVLLADTGYHKTEAIKKVEKEGIVCYIPINQNDSTLKDNENGIEFTFVEKENQYICSEGQMLKLKQKGKIDKRRNTVMNSYESQNCSRCSKKQVCCPKSPTRIKWRHQDQQWRNEYESRMMSEEAQYWIQKRKELSEHPFGIIKYWMGKIPIKLRGIMKVQTEIDIYHLAFNFKRLANITKFDQLIDQISDYKWELA